MYQKVFVAAAFGLLLTACVQKKSLPPPQEIPTDFETFCARDWKINGDIAVEEMLRRLHQEKISRSNYFTILSYIKSPTVHPRSRTISGDIRFSLLEKAFCSMVWQLSPQNISELTADCRRIEHAKLFAEFDRCSFLKEKRCMTQNEENEYQLLLTVSGADTGMDMKKVSEKFDYTSFPSGVSNKDLPDWMSWSDKLPLIWAKILIQLPTEAARAGNIDREKLLLCAEDITGSIVGHMVKQYDTVLYNKNENLRTEAQVRYERRLAQAWLRRYRQNKTADCRKEMQFLHDMYAFLQ